MSEAVSMRASDIHVEPFADRVRIRYRIDGELIERDSPPAAYWERSSLVSRSWPAWISPRSGVLKTAGSRHASPVVNSICGSAFFRPSTARRSCCGSSIERTSVSVSATWALVKKSTGLFRTSFGGQTASSSSPAQQEAERRPHLYRALGELNRPDRKIITAEDPVEYYLPGINQVEVRASIGLSFDKIIRAMLRQAPNVILVGEIRDAETADMAIQASLTGHLVFSTLHTNDAPVLSHG